jgi:hypothetical protein
MAKRVRGRDPFTQSEILGPAAVLTQESAALYYDYGQLPAEHREAVRRAARTIKPLLKRTAEDIFVIGGELRAVKAMLPHGRYTDWLGIEFGLSERMAQHFVNVRERLGPKSEKFSVLPPSTLYLLAAPSTPDAAIEVVEERIDAGDRLSVVFVQRTIAALKARPDHTPDVTVDGEIVDIPGPPVDAVKAGLQELAELEEVLEGALRLLAPAVVRRYDDVMGEDDVKRARLELSAALSKVRRRMGQQGRTRTR